MKADIHMALKAVYTLPPAIHAHVVESFLPCGFKKGEYLVKEGQICRHIFFLEQGAVRDWMQQPDGKEKTLWFSFEGDMVVDLRSFITQQPARQSIQALEDCTCLAIDYQTWQKLLNNYPGVERLYRLFLEQHIFQAEERTHRLQFLSAREHYKALLAVYPNITNRVNLGYIASFLNITQEALSRIRAALARECH